MSLYPEDLSKLLERNENQINLLQFQYHELLNRFSVLQEKTACLQERQIELQQQRENLKRENKTTKTERVLI